MKNTLELLDKALEMHPSPYWVKQLNLSRNALHSSRQRGNLSPAVAGALAEAMGLDPIPWIAVAALEGEKESACKSRMVRKFLGGAALAGSALTAAMPASAATLLEAAQGQSVYYVKWLVRKLQSRRTVNQALSSICRPSIQALT